MQCSSAWAKTQWIHIKLGKYPHWAPHPRLGLFTCPDLSAHGQEATQTLHRQIFRQKKFCRRDHPSGRDLKERATPVSATYRPCQATSACYYSSMHLHPKPLLQGSRYRSLDTVVAGLPNTDSGRNLGRLYTPGYLILTQALEFGCLTGISLVEGWIGHASWGWRQKLPLRPHLHASCTTEPGSGHSPRRTSRPWDFPRTSAVTSTGDRLRQGEKRTRSILQGTDQAPGPSRHAQKIHDASRGLKELTARSQAT